MLKNNPDGRGNKIVIKLTNEEMASLQKQIYYSDKYTDDEYEYRHVMLPKRLLSWFQSPILCQKQNGAVLEFSKAMVGYTTCDMSQSHMYCSSEESCLANDSS